MGVVGLGRTQGISVEQGKTFSIVFDCLDENGDVCVNGKPSYIYS